MYTSLLLRKTILLMLFCFTSILLIGCDSNGEGDDTPLDRVDFDALFAPPTDSEVETIINEWAVRDVSARDVQILAQDTLEALGGTSVFRVVEHRVNGVLHVGAIVEPITEEEALPVLIYSHGGDQGEDFDATLNVLEFGLSEVANGFVFVAPSFRSEPITLNGVTYQSEGEPSPWDFDVDDTIALLNTTLDLLPRADSTRIGILGASRGAGVALLAAIRDPRVDLVINYFGPTDFFLDTSIETTMDLLMGRTVNLPGVAFLSEEFLFPLADGELTLDFVRLEYIRRSAVYFADRLPAVQVHHGELDEVVSVGHALSLEQALVGANTPAGSFEVFIYPEAGHDPFEMLESFPRIGMFLERLQ